jgi:hypothetical protein
MIPWFNYKLVFLHKKFEAEMRLISAIQSFVNSHVKKNIGILGTFQQTQHVCFYAEVTESRYSDSHTKKILLTGGQRNLIISFLKSISYPALVMIVQIFRVICPTCNADGWRSEPGNNVRAKR